MARKPGRTAKQDQRRREIREFMGWLKEEMGCGECGARFPGEPYLLEYDHHDNAEKDCDPTAISKRYHSWDSVVRSLSSTAVRCGLCHTRRTRSGTPLAADDTMGEETVKLALEKWRSL